MAGFKTKRITQCDLPLVIEPTSTIRTFPEALEFVIRNREDLKTELLKAGGLLFRGFPVCSEADFSAFIKAFGLGEFLNYIGGDSPRTKVAEGIYTSTEAPPSIKIPLHNELSFVDQFPKHIYFYCQVAPEKDGETILGDARKIYQCVDKQIRKRFDENGLKYTSCYYHKSKVMDLLNSLQPSHKTWMNVFETDRKEEVEKLCRKCNFSFAWNANDWIRLTQERPATMHHPLTKESVWFNQAHLYDFNPRLLGLWRYLGAKLFYLSKHTKLHEICYRDGSQIPRKDLYHIHDVLDANTIKFPWQKGDVLVLDNVLAMHGRSTFKGKRRVLAAMTG